MSDKQTYLDKAKKVHKNKISKQNYDNQQLQDLTLAWCRDEITLTQAAKALNLKNTGFQMYSIFANCLKNYLNKNYRIKAQDIEWAEQILNTNRIWIDVKEKLPEHEGYFRVKFKNGSEDEKPFRIRPNKNIHGFMTLEEVTHWTTINPIID